MGWVTLTLRKTELKRTHADYQMRDLEISREKRQMARRYHYQQTLVSNDQKDALRTSSAKTNYETAKQQYRDFNTHYQEAYDYAKENFTGDEKDFKFASTSEWEDPYADNKKKSELEKLYDEAKEEYEEWQNSIKTTYEDELAEIEQEANDTETMLDQEQVQIEAQMEAVAQEIQAVSDAISNEVQNSTIKLS